MKSMRNLIRVVLALALAAFAMPTFAQNQKLYSLVMDPQTVVSGSVPMKAIFTNVSPQGNANFNALQLQVPDGYKVTSVTKVTRSDGTFQGTVTPAVLAPIPSPGANLIKVESMSSVGKGVNVTIEFNATVDTCAPARWNWAPDDDVWSGSQVGAGTPFAMSSLSKPTTGIAGPTLAITAFPKDVVLGVSFDVTVEQKKFCTGASFPDVSLAGTGYEGTLTSQVLSNDGSVRTSTFTGMFKGTLAGPTTLTITASDGSQQKTAQITVYADGDIGCNQEVDKVFVNNGNEFDPLEPGQARSIRQLWNSNAASCLRIPIDFTNLLYSDGKISLLWPSGPTDSQRAALFRNTVTGKPRSLTSTAVPSPPGFQFGWAKDGNGDVIYADALMCLDEEAPRPYATLVSSVTSVNIGDSFQVQWDSANAPVAPGTASTTDPSGIADPNGWKPLPATGNFEFTIGDERFIGQRDGIESTTGSVTTVNIKVVARNRGQTPSVTTPLPAGTFLLSVVMPIYTASAPSVYANKPVRMCVIANGIRMWVPAAGAADSLPTPQYFQTLEYFDGDGWGVER